MHAKSCSATAGLGEITEDSPEQVKTLCHTLILSQIDPNFSAALDEAASTADVQFSPRYDTAVSTPADYLTTDDRSLENLVPQGNPFVG